jgi:hypothetical protein
MGRARRTRPWGVRFRGGEARRRQSCPANPKEVPMRLTRCSTAAALVAASAAGFCLPGGAQAQKPEMTS